MCEKYQVGGSCYVVVDQVADPESATVNIVSYRGCYNAEDAGTAYCMAHLDKCLACSTPGCNNNPSYSESTLTCHKCDSTTDSNCEYSQEGQASARCEYNTFLGVTEQCYTHKNANGVVSRGCLLELSADHDIRKKCEANDEECLKCEGSGCNLATTEIDYGECVLCDGSVDPNCALLGESYATIKCGPSSDDVGGCFRADICKSMDILF